MAYRYFPTLGRPKVNPACNPPGFAEALALCECLVHSCWAGLEMLLQLLRTMNPAASSRSRRHSTCYAPAQDILASSGLLVILCHACLFVAEANEAASMILCSLLLICLLVCLSSIAFSALAQHIFTRLAKKYQFFLCHHKQALRREL